MMNIIENLKRQHKEKYGVEPNVIGLLWSDMDERIRLMTEAIEGDEPYDEYKMLSKEKQEAYDKGGLVF
jgi:hypothetical protein